MFIISGLVQHSIRGDFKKKYSIFKDSAQIGGGEVNPMSKNWKEMNFWQKLGREGVTKHIVKNRITLFFMIYYSVYTPVPYKHPILYD